ERLDDLLIECQVLRAGVWLTVVRLALATGLVARLATWRRVRVTGFGGPVEGDAQRVGQGEREVAVDADVVAILHDHVLQDRERRRRAPGGIDGLDVDQSAVHRERQQVAEAGRRGALHTV